MVLLQLLSYLAVIAFTIVSLTSYNATKDMLLALNATVAAVLLWSFMSKTGKAKIAPLAALVFMVSSYFLDTAKCGMCSGVGIGVILSGMRF